ncbi:MAG: hypothetical protein P4L27_08155 [Ignavibacteriaceae bacterium]|nr:hypothetical protein [Ignavibacteriaceae bacterium]
MLKIILLLIFVIHGMIHLLGFIKAYKITEVDQLTKEISKPMGLFWLLAAVLFTITFILFLLNNKLCLITGSGAVIISQLLIFYSWQDAKFGTIANIVIILILIIGYGSWRFENQYNRDVAGALKRTDKIKSAMVTESDIQSLPLIVQKYLRYTGVINKPRVENVKIIFDGEMRGKGKDWFTFSSEQYNFFDTPTRLFYMKGNIMKITVPGYHAYKNGTATMRIKLFGLIPIIDIKGRALDTTETVTFFNDMCIMAPAALIDKRIKWEEVDSTCVRGIFINNGIRISALLYFNDLGQLINFISDDRYEVSDMKKYRFSTPVSEYKEMNGIRIATHGETVWQYPEGNFTYGKFDLQSIEYNVK